MAEGLWRAVVGLSWGPRQCLLPSTPPSLIMHSSQQVRLCPLCMPHPQALAECVVPMPLAPGAVGDRGLQTGGGQLEKRLSKLRGAGGSGCPILRSWRPRETPWAPSGQGGRGDRRLQVNLGPFPFRDTYTKGPRG